MTSLASDLSPFSKRHLGPSSDELRAMLDLVGAPSLDAFAASVVPAAIRTPKPLTLDAPLAEHEALERLRQIAEKNRPCRSYIGMGYYDTHVPQVILRNILENPGWYTQYTPYQAEIAQGRLEALLNFQTVVADLTGFPIANASLLDEATAAAEAMAMFHAAKGRPAGGVFAVASNCHPQTVAVVRTRARYLNIAVAVVDPSAPLPAGAFGLLLQYPASDGEIADYAGTCRAAHAANASVVVATDLLALTLLVPPAEFGADAAVGNSQRFGVPLGYGGPHAAFLATSEEFKRIMPGRIIGVSVDSRGRRALRMALQTREQHIRREKATSNICTAQVLLAIMSGMYAVYHGPEGLTAIARRVHGLAAALAEGARSLGYALRHANYFDTVVLRPSPATTKLAPILEREGINARIFGDGALGFSVDEVTTADDLRSLLRLFAEGAGKQSPPVAPSDGAPPLLQRTSAFLTHTVFHRHRSETAMLRYIKSLEERDLSLAQSMIPLGSCTMKLNATAELVPVTWKGFNAIHPFAPPAQAEGYRILLAELEGMLTEITGFAAVSFQPNSGAQGEYAGLLVIRAYHEKRGDRNRDVCLIPASAHGTNPASAVMAGMQVVVVRSRADGSIDVDDLREKAAQHRERLGALMVTYPSTHGVFEGQIKEICAVVHEQGGLVYMDGANLNAQVGLCRPAELGADVCHMNLHKTFCIPHGGGGPGMGPIAVAKHLAPFLPSHPVIRTGGADAIGPVSAAPWGSPSIVVISWAYIAMMGAKGLTDATKIAMLNANYMARRLEEFYPVVYKGENGRVAHEFIIDLRPMKAGAGIEVEDVAKRLMDFGFHAPTTSFPVPGTLMIEPTESESKEELDRYCDALIAIRREAAAIERGEMPIDDNVLKNAPHTADMVVADSWAHPYSREQAAYPAPWIRERKFWPSVGRINSAYGDKNLVCTCPPVEVYAEA